MGFLLIHVRQSQNQAIDVTFLVQNRFWTLDVIFDLENNLDVTLWVLQVSRDSYQACKGSDRVHSEHLEVESGFQGLTFMDLIHRIVSPNSESILFAFIFLLNEGTLQIPNCSPTIAISNTSYGVHNVHNSRNLGESPPSPSLQNHPHLYPSPLNKHYLQFISIFIHRNRENHHPKRRKNCIWSPLYIFQRGKRGQCFLPVQLPIKK